MKGDRNTIRISGGNFQGTAIGIGHTEQHGTAVGAARIDELRTALAAESGEIVALGRTEDERAELRHELRKIQQELATEEPDGAGVRTRWNSVLAVLDAAVAASQRVATITDLVQSVFGG